MLKFNTEHSARQMFLLAVFMLFFLEENVRGKLVRANQYAGLHEHRLSVFDQWRITVPKGQRVRLTFTSFDLVPEVCGDFVQVFDGYTADSSSLGKYDISEPLPVWREEHWRNHSVITPCVTPEK